MQKSLWQECLINKTSNNFNKKTDVLIIGGGLSGINTAYFLKDSNMKVTLIEANEIGSGTTSLTTGKLTYLQDTMYTDIENIYGFDTANSYLKSQLFSLNLIKKIIKENKIKCDYIENDSYIFCTNDKDKSKIDKEYQFLKKSNISVKKINKLPINFPCKYAIKVEDTAVFNPIKYINQIYNIIRGKIDICEKVRALDIKKDKDNYVISTTKDKITTKYVCICTHYPFFIVPLLIPFKTHIEKSHVLAAKISNIEKFNAISIGKQTYSIRYHKDKDCYLIFAGESYKMSNHINYEKRMEELREKFKELFNLNIDYEWSIHDIKSNDILPIIGRVDNENKNMLVSCAFNKWGMLNSVLSGKILSDIILNNENEYIKLFNPVRKITIKRTINFFVDSFNISKIYISTKINKNRNFYKNNVKFKNINGKSYGIYIDENKKEHIVRNLCPHMKCSLIFNYMDKTWDCPCHGSKFDIDGNVIKGPSVYNIKIENSNNIN